MPENKKMTKQIPDNFASIEEATDFWDNHSLADFWEQTQEVTIEVRAPRRQWIALEGGLAKKTAERARQEGVSIETLVNLWVAEHLQTQA